MVEQSGRSTTTGDDAWALCTNTASPLFLDELQDKDFAVTDEDTARARMAIAWAQHSTDEGTFARNLRVAALNATVERRTVGIAAYLVEGHRRAVEESRKSEKPVGGWVGTPGKRETFAGLQVTRIREFNNDFGTCYFVNLQDAAGNALTWKASTYPGWAYEAEASGELVSIKATVKAHEDSARFGLQTLIQRAALI